MMAWRRGALFIILLSVAVPVMAQQQDANHSRDDTYKIVRDILLNDPELLQNSLNNLAKYQKQKSDLAFAKSVEKFQSFLEDDKGMYIGSKESSSFVIAFTDFNCKFCAKMTNYLKNNPSHPHKIIIKELPILGEFSEYMARIAISSSKFGAYEKFYFAAFSMPHATKEEVRAIIRNIGLDPEEVEKEAKELWVTETLNKNKQVASELGINATPTLIYRGKKVMGGFAEVFQIPKSDVEK